MCKTFIGLSVITSWCMKVKTLAWVDAESNPERPKLMLNDERVIPDFLKLQKHGRRVWVTIETYYPKRSQEQNKTIHWYFDMIADETGMELEDVKLWFAKKYLTVPTLDADGKEVADPETGEVLTKTLSTSKLTTVEMMEYMDKIHLFCVEYLAFELPLPEKNIKLRLK